MEDSKELEELFSKLEIATHNKKRGKCTKIVHTLDSGEVVTSWKFNEFEYASNSVVLPSEARGLFTVGDDRIVIRGYDKFFCVEELLRTSWATLEETTCGPYTLALKENGCIVFMSGLNEQGELLVTSKHLFKNREGTYGPNHASQGEIELNIQLQKLGLTPSEFGRYLFENNLTAVAELCDDSFEEHVLPYSKEEAGLYLHGLNYNTVKFKTCDVEMVDEVADRFGFKKIGHFSIAEFDDLKEFLVECNKTGTYEGREVEGFVIRSHLKSDGSDFFFKYKFEEPYLLYRDMREVTRLLVEGTDKVTLLQETTRYRNVLYRYVEFTEKLFKEQPLLVDDFKNGRGVIKIRNLFCDELLSKGMDLRLLNNMDEDAFDNSPHREFRYILVPIATIGCGKTTVFQTIQHLYPDLVGHIQNDNIPTKAKFNLVDTSLNELALDMNKKIICCDKNNAESRERRELFENFKEVKKRYLLPTIKMKYICCNFISPDKKTLWDVTFGRVKERGDNHQSLNAVGEENKVRGVMGGFIKRRQDLDLSREPDSQFDLVIDLIVDKRESSFDNVKRILQFLNENYPGLIPNYPPTEEQLREAFSKALSYKPTYRKRIPMGSSRKRGPKIQYYGIRIQDKSELQANITKLLKPVYSDDWNLIEVQNEFHVTIAHASARRITEKKLLWKILDEEIFAANLVAKVAEEREREKDIADKKTADKEVGDEEFTSVKPSPVVELDFYCDVKVNNIIIAKGKLICLEVDILKSYDSPEDDANEVEGIKCTNDQAHITIGTCSDEVRAYESNNILVELRKLKENGLDSKYTLENGVEVEIVKFEPSIILKKQRCFAYK